MNILEMKLPLLICGIGNPGKRYANSRHSIGLLAVEKLRERLAMPAFAHSGDHGRVSHVDDGTILFLSDLYMNDSGRALKHAMRKWRANEAVVIHDELETSVGKCHFRKMGSAKGHNGLKSIIKEMHEADIYSFGIGIGRPESREPRDVAEYVLSSLGEEDFKALELRIMPQLETTLQQLRQTLSK